MAVALEVHVREDADAGGRHHAEHHQARAAEHELRNGFDEAAILGSMPSTIMITMPPATQTQRLFTPVTPTSPTFCEKLV